ncbi:MAG: glycosyltransferase [Candidatus Woesearchaeota archaeon]|jgi:GT2 family glycosyltransferase/glycosyltransferase involved in cell wall biosynthesis
MNPSEKHTPKVSIIILNWNGKQDTDDCLISLKKLDYNNYNIIIIDNGSTDDSVAYLKAKYPQVTILENKVNLGFTGGNNVGIKEAIKNGTKYVILLNNDTVVDKNMITEMIKGYQFGENVGLVGPKVVYYSNDKKIWCAGGHYNKFLGKGKMYDHYTRKKKNLENITGVDWISFCVVMIKTEVFEKIGLLDNDFFFNSEDLDFCRRAVKNKFTCVYTPKAIVKHKISQDSGGLNSSFNIYYQVRNTLLFYKKNRSLLGFCVSLIYYLLLSIPYRMFTFLKEGNGKKIKYFGYGITDFLKGNYGKGILSEKIKTEQTQRLRIGINARYLQRKVSGIERYLQELIVNLSKIDCETEYYLFFNKHAPIPTLNLPPNFKIIISSFPANSQILRIIWDNLWLWYEIKKYNIDIFHGPAFFLPLLKPNKCKYVVTVHDITFIKFKEMFTWETYWYYNFFFNSTLRKADIVLCDSNSTKKDIMSYAPYFVETNINAIHLGVKKENIISKRETEIKKKYNLSFPFYLFVGTFSPRKNILRIIQAWQKRKDLKIKLILIGKKGWLFEEIFTYIKESNLENDILFLDYIPEEDLPYFYYLAEALLFPSLYEGFGLPILEAMAYGCPVITSNISSMPEIAGDAALFIDPLNINEITKAMETIVQDKKLREKLIKKGYERVTKFSWQKMAEKTREVYDNITNKRK